MNFEHGIPYASLFSFEKKNILRHTMRHRNEHVNLIYTNICKFNQRCCGFAMVNVCTITELFMGPSRSTKLPVVGALRCWILCGAGLAFDASVTSVV